MSYLNTATLTPTEEQEQEESFSQQSSDDLAKQTYIDNLEGIDIDKNQPENLVDKQDLIKSGRDIRKNKWLNLAASLIAASAFGIFGLMMFSMVGKIMSVGQGNNQNTEQEEAPDSEEQAYLNKISDLEDKLEKKNVELAYDPKDTSDWEKIEPENNPQQTEAKESDPAPSKPQTQPQARAQPQPQPQRVEPQVEEVNPLDRWALLASQGIENGENDLTQESEVESIANLATSDTSAPEENRDLVTKSSVAPPQTTSIEPTRENNLNLPKDEVVQIASVAIGKDTTDEAEEVTPESELESEITDFLSGESRDVAPPTYLERKREEYRQADLLAGKTQTPPPQLLATAAETPPTYLERKREEFRQADLLAGKIQTPPPQLVATAAETPPTYLERKREEFRQADLLAGRNGLSKVSQADRNSEQEASKTSNISFGSTVRGELTTNIVWSEGTQSSHARGMVDLSEPLYGDNDEVALEAGSSLIVEVSTINTSGLAQLQVVGVSYENDEGRLVQQAIPPDSILIQGTEGALIAERANGSGSSNFGQDLLLAGLGAGERAFELRNEPELRERYGDRFDDDDDRLGFGSITRTQNENSSLATGAAEGAFATTKERLEDRSEQIDTDSAATSAIFELESGTGVNVFINSFFSIEN